MPLKPQEQRCVEAACRLLGQLRGGSWEVRQTPDDLHPNSKSPDALLSNGSLTAAVEVTRLSGGSAVNEHLRAWDHLFRRLQPSRPGYFQLVVPDGFALPIPKNFIRMLKREIERASTQLKEPGDLTFVRIPRSVSVSSVNLPDVNRVVCLHAFDIDIDGGMIEVLRSASRQVSGYHLILDLRQWGHSFGT
jgi:hypothetical protein